MSFWNWEKLHNRTNSENIIDFLNAELTHEKLQKEWNVHDAITVWSKTYAYWLSFSNKNNVIIVRYEDLINRFDDTMNSIVNSLGLEQKTRGFVNFSTRADDWKKPSSQNKLDIDYYKNKQYMNFFDQTTISFIFNKLDREVIQKLGYNDHII